MKRGKGQPVVKRPGAWEASADKLKMGPDSLAVHLEYAGYKAGSMLILAEQVEIPKPS